MVFFSAAFAIVGALASANTNVTFFNGNMLNPHLFLQNLMTRNFLTT
jgi:hypothetical protein